MWDGAVGVGAVADLVVEHDQDVAVGGGEGGCAVVDAGARVTFVGAGLAGFGDHAVGEALGQGEHPGRVVEQRSVTGDSRRGRGARNWGGAQCLHRAEQAHPESELPGAA